MRRSYRTLLSSISLMLLVCSVTHAAAPGVADALKLSPVQRDVDFDRPDAKQVAGCSIKSEQLGGRSGWVVRGPAGQLLRCFADTNGDGKVDQWCYYHNGIEAYRDLDTDFNGKADQYRWLGLEGSRWGIDANEDGRIDSWKSISAEEVTAEIVAGLRTGDPQRFATVLLSPTELKALGLGKETSAKISQSISTAAQRFGQLARTQKIVKPDANWMHFGATRPSVMPAGTGGSSLDVTVYENVVAMLEQGKKPGQLSIGTLVKVGDSWRAIDVPVGLLDDEQSLAASSYLLQSVNEPPGVAGDIAANPKELQEQQELAERLQKAEQRIQSARNARERAAAYEESLGLYTQLAQNAKKPDEYASWMKQMADVLGTAAQTQEYDKAMPHLADLYHQLAKKAPKEDLTGYVKFRYMNAQYASELNAEDADFDAIQKDWLAQLEEFVGDFPTCEDTSEAMFDLAIGEEFQGNEDKAIGWYTEILRRGKSEDAVVKKANGAIARLKAVGKPLQIQGRTVHGKTLDTKDLKGRLVLIQYWATFSDASKADIKRIAKLNAEYGRRGFVPVSISVDTDTSALQSYLTANRIDWPVLYETGGLNSRLATQLGILTVPTMILIDEKGNCIDRNLQVNQLEAILEKQLAAKANLSKRTE